MTRLDSNMNSGPMKWVSTLVRVLLALLTTVAVTIGLTTIATAWLDVMSEYPWIDHVAESIIRYLHHISSATFLVVMVYNFSDMVRELEVAK
ncbi:hypothetical protein ES702_02634 [subsurface metagenome]